MTAAKLRGGDRVRVTVVGVVKDADEILARVVPDFGDGYSVAAFATDPRHGWRVEVLDPVAVPEPPLGSVVLMANGTPAWRRGTHSHGWRGGDGYDRDWSDLTDCQVIHIPGRAS